MKTSFPRLLLALIALPLLLVAALVVAYSVNSVMSQRFAASFAKVQSGESRERVIALLGAPARTRGCGESLWWGNDTHYLGPNEGRCTSEDRYEYFLVAFGVGYSDSGEVVSKYEYVSE